MKHYESYVAEAKARRRRRLAVGIVGAVMLATVAMTALLVFNPPLATRSPLSAGCTPDVAAAAGDCDRVSDRRAG
jgi:hypothetical protein